MLLYKLHWVFWCHCAVDEKRVFCQIILSEQTNAKIIWCSGLIQPRKLHCFLLLTPAHNVLFCDWTKLGVAHMTPNCDTHAILSLPLRGTRTFKSLCGQNFHNLHICASGFILWNYFHGTVYISLLTFSWRIQSRNMYCMPYANCTVY